jgi:hypothetical protein
MNGIILILEYGFWKPAMVSRSPYLRLEVAVPLKANS